MGPVASVAWRSLVSVIRRSLEQRGSISDLGEAIAASRRHLGSGGGPVSPEQALRLGAVWSCVDLICRLSALPVHQYRKAEDVREQVAPSPLLTNPHPGSGVSPIGWRRQVLMSWVTRGNVFGRVLSRDRLLYPTAVEILDPGRMRARRRGLDGPIEWTVDGMTINPDDLIHWPAFTVPGSSIGLAPLEYAASMIGLGLTARDFGARWFDDGAHPSGMLTTEQAISREDAQTIKQRFLSMRGTREPFVAGKGLKYEALQISPEESQFLETIQANGTDIAGFFLVPPELVGQGTAGSSITYANVEQRGLSYLTWNASWWLALMDEFLSSMTPRGQYVKVNPSAYLAVDARTQATVHEIRIRGGWGTPDEARSHEDLPPLPDGAGEQHLWPPYATSVQATTGGPPNA